jgi:hypothetical protein
MSDDHSCPYWDLIRFETYTIVREAYAMAPTMTTRLPWSEHLITFNEDQPEHSIDISRFPLVVSTILKTVRATKIIMDGGSDSNLIYWDTFKRLKIGIDKLCPLRVPITRIVPGRQVMTSFEVVNF